MRELVVSAFVSLDSVMQAPGGREEDTSGGFEYGGWFTPLWDDTVAEHMGESMGKPFDLVLGRKTYEIFASHWPHTDDPGAEELNSATKHVASRTLTELDWQNSYLIEGDVADGVRELKEQDGPELQVHGSPTLLQTLLAHELVDELRLVVCPLVLGTGKRLFGGGELPTGLELTASKLSSTGAMIATYRTGAEIKLATFGED